MKTMNLFVASALRKRRAKCDVDGADRVDKCGRVKRSGLNSYLTLLFLLLGTLLGGQEALAQSFWKVGKNDVWVGKTYTAPATLIDDDNLVALNTVTVTVGSNGDSSLQPSDYSGCINFRSANGDPGDDFQPYNFVNYKKEKDNYTSIVLNAKKAVHFTAKIGINSGKNIKLWDSNTKTVVKTVTTNEKRVWDLSYDLEQGHIYVLYTTGTDARLLQMSYSILQDDFDGRLQKLSTSKTETLDKIGWNSNNWGEFNSGYSSTWDSDKDVKKHSLAYWGRLGIIADPNHYITLSASNGGYTFHDIQDQLCPFLVVDIQCEGKFVVKVKGNNGNYGDTNNNRNKVSINTTNSWDLTGAIEATAGSGWQVDKYVTTPGRYYIAAYDGQTIESIKFYPQDLVPVPQYGGDKKWIKPNWGGLSPTDNVNPTTSIFDENHYLKVHADGTGNITVSRNGAIQLKGASTVDPKAARYIELRVAGKGLLKVRFSKQKDGDGALIIRKGDTSGEVIGTFTCPDNEEYTPSFYYDKDEETSLIIWVTNQSFIQEINWIPNSATTTVAPVLINLTPTTLSLMEGETSSQLEVTFNPTNASGDITWNTSDGSKATVSNGYVTGVAEGNATITATVGSVTSNGCAVTVNKPNNAPLFNMTGSSNGYGCFHVYTHYYGNTPYYYTLDGSDPTTSSQQVDWFKPLPPGKYTVKLMYVLNGETSSIATWSGTINATADLETAALETLPGSWKWEANGAHNFGPKGVRYEKNTVTDLKSGDRTKGYLALDIDGPSYYGYINDNNQLVFNNPNYDKVRFRIPDAVRSSSRQRLWDVSQTSL